jgi:hypothetical protein
VHTSTNIDLKLHHVGGCFWAPGRPHRHSYLLFEMVRELLGLVLEPVVSRARRYCELESVQQLESSAGF